jgi:ankyrin repeat protein
MWYESMVKANELFSVDSSTGNIVFHEDLIDIASDEDRENALRYGVLTVRLKIVIPLLNTGVNPSIMYGGRSLLCTAGMLGYTYIVEELLDAGADITFKDRYEGMTALQHAARRKHRDIVALLLAKVKELKNVNK